MKKYLSLFLLALVFVASIAFYRPTTKSVSSSGQIVVASKGFTEQDILSELLAQQITAHTGLTVGQRRFNGLLVTHAALQHGDIDAYVEYTGTAFTSIVKQSPIADTRAVYRRLKQLYDTRFQLEVMPPLGFENTFAIIVRGDDAKRYNLKTLSESTRVTPQWQAGFGYEFLEREDGFPGLQKTYNLQFARPPKVMDLGLIYLALVEKQVDLIAGNSTDGQIARLGLVVLEDDKHYFPPYEAVPIVRQATLSKYPKLRPAIEQLAGKITADEMRQLNYLVEGELRDVREVAREFLVAKGLVNDRETPAASVSKALATPTAHLQLLNPS